MYKDNMKTPSLVFQMVKNPPTSSGEAGSSPGSGRSPEEGNGYPPQYSCLEIPRTEESGRPQGHRVGHNRATTPNDKSKTNSSLFFSCALCVSCKAHDLVIYIR